MKSKITDTLIRYGIVLAIGLFFVWFVLWVNNYSTIVDEAKRLKVLADSFTVPGMVLLMVGLLTFLSGMGAVDGLAYAVGGLVRRLIPGGRNSDSEKETYYEYIQRKRAKKKGGISVFFVVGGLFILIAVFFIIKFYQVY